MPLGRVVLALAVRDRWLLTYGLSMVAVLAGATLLRRAARIARRRARRRDAGARRGIRRGSGVVLVLGPLLGFATSPTLAEHALLATAGAVVLGVLGTVFERRTDVDRAVAVMIGIASTVAVIAGVRLAPTGVGAFDVAAAWAIVALVLYGADGFGDTDALIPGLGLAGGLGVFALAGFAGQDSLAAVALGLAAACFAFLAFNLRPASLFAGRGGRLACGYVLAVGALSVRLPVGPTGRVLVPALLLGLFLVGALIVVADRLRRGQSLIDRRRDALVHRLRALGFSSGLAVAALVGAQLALGAIAVFAGRGVLALWLGIAIAAVILTVIATEAGRGRLSWESPAGYPRALRVGAGIVALAALLAVAPAVLVASDVRDLMERGRAAATRALAAARQGDDARAELGFRQAAAAFGDARDKLQQPLLTASLAVPGLASNVRAARTLASIGRDLARAGEKVTTAVDPDALRVRNGRLPLEEVRRVAPVLSTGARALDRALRRLRGVHDPYLVAIVSDAVHKVRHQLARAAGEARRTAAAARLASAIFGGHATRSYLLVVQNNAELRATGGLIGNWGVLTVTDGHISVGRLLRTSAWNEALAALPNPVIDAPADYHRRYDRLQPERGLQDVNLSENFPTVGRVLASLAPQVGLPPIDGVLAVDPLGLQALLELTGPVFVSNWPEPITAANVVNVTLRDAYAAFADTPQRADFLGDVAAAVVDTATSTSLGTPARIAQVLGRAAHEGHVLLWFTRPAEQRLAKQLSVAGELAPVRSDALAVNTQNAAANKIDYYLKRRIEYRVRLMPDANGRTARVRAHVKIRLDNTAPDTGLPQIVIGPYTDAFVAGVNRSWVSAYTPLAITRATVDGTPMAFDTYREAGRLVHSGFIDIPARSARTVVLTLEGRVRLGAGGWYELALDHQPTIAPDRVQVSLEVPEGWAVARAPGLVKPFDRQATGLVTLNRDRRVRVQVTRAVAGADLWERLQAGS